MQFPHFYWSFGFEKSDFSRKIFCIFAPHRSVDPGHGHPLRDGTELLHDGLQLPDGLVDVVVDQHQVEEVAEGLAQRLRLLHQPLQAPVGLQNFAEKFFLRKKSNFSANPIQKILRKLKKHQYFFNRLSKNLRRCINFILKFLAQKLAQISVKRNFGFFIFSKISNFSWVGEKLSTPKYRT